jgi:mannose-1-phosphate guanylyltransferase/mannose-6-phosphate isomerase
MARRIALVMAGGGGTRLWPAASDQRPKPLVPGLPGPGETLLGATLARIGGLVDPGDVFVVTTADQAPAVRAALGALDAQQLIVEPAARNTAPAIALAVCVLRARLGPDADATIVALPADHVVADRDALVRHLEAACAHARAHDTLATLGIEASRPDTGYGYIEHDATALPAVAGDLGIAAHRARRFVEKPDAATARAFVAGGRHRWNAGIFVLPLARVERDLARHAPRTWDSLAPVRAALAAGADPTAAMAVAYESVVAEPFDVAVLEKLDDLVVVPAAIGWSDLGTWASVAAALPHDASGSATHTGPAAATSLLDTHDCLVWNEDASVAVVGVSGLAIVVCGGKILVCPLDRAQGKGTVFGS